MCYTDCHDKAYQYRIVGHLHKGRNSSQPDTTVIIMCQCAEIARVDGTVVVLPGMCFVK